MPLVPKTISRDPTTGVPVLDHNVGAGTFSAAPTLNTDGFPIRPEGGGSFDAFEMTYSYDATADTTTAATVKPWFYIPAHNPGGVAQWLSGRDMEDIRLPDATSTTTDIFSPVRRINSVPTAATRMYLQVVVIAGTAPTNLYLVAYGLVGIVANVDVGDIQVDIEPSGITIGAVKLEDGATTDKATVRDANVVGAPTDHVLVVQPLDANGNVLKGGGGVGGGAAIYSVGQGDLTAVYTSAETLTTAGLSYTPDTTQFVTVTKWDSTGKATSYTPDANAFGYVAATGVLTVTGAAFAATDLGYDILLWGPPKGWTQATDSNRVEEIAPVNFAVTEETLVDTTNLAISAGYYYPSDDGLVMLGSKNFSLTGQLICSGIMTMTVEVTSDPHATPASRVWSVIYGFRADLNAMTNSVGVDNSTQSFAWDFDGLNAKYVRVRVVVANATNTVKIFARRTAL